MWAGAIRSGRFPRYLYIPYGPTAEPGLGATAVESASREGRARGLDFVRLEPLSGDAGALSSAGAVPTQPIQPPTTWVLDLAPEETLRAGLSSGHRGAINAAARRNITIRTSNAPADIDVYLEIAGKARRRGGFRGQTDRYLRTVATTLMPDGTATLYVADVEGAEVAAAICFDFAETRYYASAVTDPDIGRRAGAAAPLVWRMILDAHARGVQRFDFWGIASSADATHPWAGFTQFKKAFGGRELQRSGTWDLPLRGFRHRAYRVLQRLRR